jgi:hypothetical protein
MAPSMRDTSAWNSLILQAERAGRQAERAGRQRAEQQAGAGAAGSGSSRRSGQSRTAWQQEGDEWLGSSR